MPCAACLRSPLRSSPAIAASLLFVANVTIGNLVGQYGVFPFHTYTHPCAFGGRTSWAEPLSSGSTLLSGTEGAGEDERKHA